MKRFSRLTLYMKNVMANWYPFYELRQKRLSGKIRGKNDVKDCVMNFLLFTEIINYACNAKTYR